MKRTILTVIAILTLAGVAYGQEADTAIGPDWLKELGTYAKVFGLVLAGLGTILGLPLAILNFKKTRAEIRKLELEAKALESNTPSENQNSEGYQIKIANSQDVNVKILADPRFLGPLLLLLDFIIAWVIITLLSYLLGLVGLGVIKTLVVLVVAGILLIPILRESVRVRKLLRPKEEENTKPNKK